MQIMRWRLLMGTNRSQVRDQLSGKTLGDLTPSLLGTAGSRVFLNTGTANDQTAVVSIADSFRAVHLPSLGQVIPQSGEFVTATVADTPNKIVSPSGNEVFRVEAIDVLNAYSGGGLPPTLTAIVRIADPDYPTTDRSVVIAKADITLSEPQSLIIPANLFVDSNAVITVEASEASLTFTAYVTKVVQ